MSNPVLSGLAVHEADADCGDHAAAFERIVVREGEPVTRFFEMAGITQLAELHAGICAFRLKGELAIYQSRNHPIVDEANLAPPLASLKNMLGRFVGTIKISDPLHRRKRMAFESVVGNKRFLDAAHNEAQSLIATKLAALQQCSRSVNDFAIDLVSTVVSKLTGLIDLKNLSLYEAFQSPGGEVAHGLVESAAQAFLINTPPPPNKTTFRSFVELVLLGNYESLVSAPSSNLIRQYFTISDIRFTKNTIRNLSDEECAELATIIIATFETTTLTLIWLLAYVGQNSNLARQLHDHACSDIPENERESLLELYVLETIRLGGSNPTAALRRVIEAFTFQHESTQVSVPENTTIWLDRYRANRDPAIFPFPLSFDLANIRALSCKRSDRAASLLSRNRHEINSFVNVNTFRNERKCPGRAFTVWLITLIASELFRSYDVELSDVDTTLMRHSALARPARAGQILTKPRSS